MPGFWGHGKNNMPLPEWQSAYKWAFMIEKAIFSGKFKQILIIQGGGGFTPPQISNGEGGKYPHTPHLASKIPCPPPPQIRPWNKNLKNPQKTT